MTSVRRRRPAQRPRPYRPLPHTADLGWRIRGASLAEIFVNAAQALTATLTDRRRLRRLEVREVAVEAPDREALLVAWLNRLLYLYDMDGFLGRDFEIVHLAPETLTGRATGEIFDPARHVAKSGVKAATYHHLEIAPRPDGWQATVILDL